MLSVVMLSVSACFAADAEDTIAADNELTIEETLAVEEIPAVSADEIPVVTNDTFYNYFDETGGLRENVTSNELIFEGIFENLSGSEISIDRSISLIGKGAVFNNISLSVNADNVTVTGFTINQFKGANAIFVCGEGVTVSNATVNFVDGIQQNTIAILVLNSDSFKLLDSSISYVGTNGGNYLNNAIGITNSNGIQIKRNKINASLVSSYIPTVEIPMGSGNWVSYILSEGIVIDSSDDVEFEANVVDVTYNSVFGVYDTIYALQFRNTNNAIVKSNNISALGHTFIYGILLAGDKLEVVNNILDIKSDLYYANGMYMGGNSSQGVVSGNNVSVESPDAAYGICSSMHGNVKDMTYSHNFVACEGYRALGMELMESNPLVNYSTVYVKGNYTYGIVADVNGIGRFVENAIAVEGTNTGNISIGDSSLPYVSMAISINGGAEIFENYIHSHAIGISCTEGEVNIHDNEIEVLADANVDNGAIYIYNTQNVSIFKNDVIFVGATDGFVDTDAVYLYNVTSSSIQFNNFSITIPSAALFWQEIPEGSGNYERFAISNGIAIGKSKDITIADNNISLNYNDVVGIAGTIYVLNVYADGVTIKQNNINATGDEYIYGILISGEDFKIIDNNISINSDFYANGIDIEGYAEGVVEGNEIMVKANTSAYAIYSDRDGKNGTSKYVSNKIVGSAYNVFGLSLGDMECEVTGNEIHLFGNYTTGIAYTGDFITVSENNIILVSSEQGNESIDESFGVESVGVKVINGTPVIKNNNITSNGKGVSLTGDLFIAGITENRIEIFANDDKDAYAVYVSDINSQNGVWVRENTIDYHGATQGSGINNAIYINNARSTVIDGNKLSLDLVSLDVPWKEIPSGSGKWVATPFSEGIVIENSSHTLIYYNTIDVVYSEVLGDYDTIYVLDINSNDVKVSNNTITALGSGYIYGIVVSGENFDINQNNIETASDYYANGIDVEGSASGVIRDNEVMAKANVSAYAIYSGMNGADVSVNYTDNIFVADAYNAFGMSLGDVESNIKGNSINLVGNYTTGIAYKGSKLLVDDNTITASGSDVGDLPVWESFGVENIGIKVVMGESSITNNNIITSGYYAVDVMGNYALVHDNVLLGKKFIGDESVANAGEAVVYNNAPVIANKTATSITITEINGNGNVSGILADADGNPVSNDVIVYSVDGVNKTATTDSEGKFVIPAGNGVVVISFAEDSYLSASNVTIKLTDLSPSKLASQFNVTEGVSIKTYAVDSKAGETGKTVSFKLTDSNGNPIANAAIKFAYKSVILNRTTDENGIVYLGISTQVAQEALCAMSFMGDGKYDAAFVAFSFDIQKKPITITAAAKTYKVSTKTKKYTVTIKTQKCNSKDGKVYLSSGKKLTIKINGITYSAKTNSKGQATFKITKLTKKGRYIAAVSFAGDKTYASATTKVKITVN